MWKKFLRESIYRTYVINYETGSLNTINYTCNIYKQKEFVFYLDTLLVHAINTVSLSGICKSANTNKKDEILMKIFSV